ncbi:ATP-binding protein [Candidatus Magnetomorum sp. HK-1]|nr:ATP-binding protein [Candidatus Magnetomorum sp. HK-1]
MFYILVCNFNPFLKIILGKSGVWSQFLGIKLSGIIVIVGNYGSGKTEVSINLAVYNKRSGVQVQIGDLDLVNPYFRTREAKKVLSCLGIDVILPPGQFLQADLPILTPEISGMIKRPAELAILDVGGDHVGATVLSSLANAFLNQNVTMIQIVNPFRPFTNTIEGSMTICKEIEKASRLTVKGIIGNANFIDETSPETIYEGYDFVTRLSKTSNLPLMCITAPVEIIQQLDTQKIDCPILPIERQLVPPWLKPRTLGPKNFILH